MRTHLLPLCARGVLGLLGLGGRTATPGCAAPITTYPTYYGHWQAVLEDPEGIVFRMGAAALPAGVEAAAAPWRR